MLEKRLAAVPPQLFTSNGMSNGAITVADSSLFKVKQQVNISALTLPDLNLEIKHIPDALTIIVGPIGGSIYAYSDVSLYTVLLSATISAIEQKRPSIPQEEIIRATYEEEPTVALRTTLVDKYGNNLSTEGNLKVVQIPKGVAYDAFGRFRSSSPKLIFESIFKYDKAPLLWDESITGGGTAVHDINSSSVLLSVGTASGDKVIRQTFRYFQYYPGRSQLIFMTGNIGIAKINLRQRIGYFDHQNGLFFEQSTGSLKVVSRTFTSGTVVDNVVTQSNWNIDRFDGTGPSGVILDISKQQLFAIDFEWLGSGRVRMGFVINGSFTYCHQFDSANILTLPYMTTGKLPCRYEIENTGVTGSASSIRQTCATVISEGGEAGPGIVRSVNCGTAYRAVVADVRIPLISIRLQPAFNRATLQMVHCEVLNSTAANYLFEIVLNGVLTGATFTNVAGYAQKDVSATAITGGTVITSGYSSGGVISFENLDIDTLRIDSNITGVSNVLSLVITSFAVTQIVGSIDYKEIV